MGPSPKILGNVLSPTRKDVHKPIIPVLARFVNPFLTLLLPVAHESPCHGRSGELPTWLPDATKPATGANVRVHGEEMATPFQTSARRR